MKANLLKSAIVLAAVTGSAGQKNKYVKLKKQLQKDCDTLQNDWKSKYPKYSKYIDIETWKQEFDKQKVPTPKNFKECEKMVKEPYYQTNNKIASIYEGSVDQRHACYLRDKFDKIDKGLTTNIETHNLNSDTFELFKTILGTNAHDFRKNNSNGNRAPYTLISKDTTFTEHRENFEKIKNKTNTNEDFIKFLFLAGEKEVPDFHRALFSLQHSASTLRCPAKIVSTAILNDDSFSEKEKNKLVEFLKNTKNLDKSDNVKRNSEFEKALKEACQSIKLACLDPKDSNHVLLKGGSITGTSTYNLMAWDTKPLRDWVKDNMPAEKNTKEIKLEL